MKVPVSIIEQRHRLFITCEDLVDIALLVSVLMVVIKFWNWVLPIWFT